MVRLPRCSSGEEGQNYVTRFIYYVIGETSNIHFETQVPRTLTLAPDACNNKDEAQTLEKWIRQRASLIIL